MINVINLIGACGLIALSPMSHIESYNNDIVIDESTAGRSFWTDGNDFDFGFTLSQDIDFMTWRGNLENYTLNYYGRLSYYDGINQQFNVLVDSSLHSVNSSWANLFTQFQSSVSGFTVGVLEYISKASDNTGWYYQIGYVCSDFALGRYNFSDSSGSFLMSTSFDIYSCRYSTSSITTLLNITSSQTLDYINNFNYGFNLEDILLIQQGSQKYLPITHSCYRKKYSNDEWGYIQGSSYTFRFRNWSEEGYQQGYSEGYNTGASEGYQNGYVAGFNDADNMDATAVSIFTGIVNVGLIPINFFLEMLNFEVFGINIGAFVSATLTIAIVIIIIRIVTGKKND